MPCVQPVAARARVFQADGEHGLGAWLADHWWRATGRPLLTAVNFGADNGLVDALFFVIRDHRVPRESRQQVSLKRSLEMFRAW